MRPRNSTFLPGSLRMSPTSRRSAALTTALKEHLPCSAQKSTYCAPFSPWETATTFPETQVVFPMCLEACEKGMHEAPPSTLKRSAARTAPQTCHMSRVLFGIEPDHSPANGFASYFLKEAMATASSSLMSKTV